MTLREVPKNVWEFLDGKKSFIGAVVLFVVGGAKALNWVDQQTFEFVAAIAGAIAAYGIRAAIGKLKK